MESGSAHAAGERGGRQLATRWGSAYADPQWITVDLGATRSISRVRLNWEAAYGRRTRCRPPRTTPPGPTVYSTTTGDGGVDDLTVSGTGRYVRVYGTQRALPAYGYSLWDLDVYGS